MMRWCEKYEFRPVLPAGLPSPFRFAPPLDAQRFDLKSDPQWRAASAAMMPPNPGEFLVPSQVSQQMLKPCKSALCWRLTTNPRCSNMAFGVNVASASPLPARCVAVPCLVWRVSNRTKHPELGCWWGHWGSCLLMRSQDKASFWYLRNRRVLALTCGYALQEAAILSGTFTGSQCRCRRKQAARGWGRCRWPPARPGISPLVCLGVDTVGPCEAFSHNYINI